MKINWKIRLKSGPFLMAATAAFLLFLKALLELMGLALPVATEEILRVAQLLLVFLATVGIVSDPTTSGIGDSQRALAYRVPGGAPAVKTLVETHN